MLHADWRVLAELMQLTVDVMQVEGGVLHGQRRAPMERPHVHRRVLVESGAVQTEDGMLPSNRRVLVDPKQLEGAVLRARVHTKPVLVDDGAQYLQPLPPLREHHYRNTMMTTPANDPRK